MFIVWKLLAFKLLPAYSLLTLDNFQYTQFKLNTVLIISRLNIFWITLQLHLKLSPQYLYWIITHFMHFFLITLNLLSSTSRSILDSFLITIHSFCVYSRLFPDSFWLIFVSWGSSHGLTRSTSMELSWTMLLRW